MRLLSTFQERLFWDKVQKGNGCWQWLGWTNAKGYGYTKYKDCPERLAHRVAFILDGGVIPEGMVLDHLCRNSSCVRPSHLEVVTGLENYRRSPHPGTRESCPQGHPYTPENTYRYPPSRGAPNGRRECRRCSREYKAAYKRRQKA